ncbi:hypothetical protein [uncultured Porphyromonas sp.]|uniref:hypothetical protein n=1 Tax=uncultured Porphyromonas sp. TaxID=159274 RepID=UPI002638ECDE|nr:hypothetical protein [uncultured Porphyromonas sp.]
MNNLDAIYKGLSVGRNVYIIDEYEGYALKYYPGDDDSVLLKTKGGTPKKFPSSDEDVFESTLAGKVVSEEEFNSF